jgi:putative ABC transport system ATP-binding protein
MISIQQLTKVYNKGKENEVMAMNALGLDIEAGEFVVIVGSNGSGKSTLMNMILGADRPDSGKIMVDGEDISGLAQHRRSKWISMVFQNPSNGTASELSILENFRLASLRSGSKNLKIGMNAEFREKVFGLISSLGMGLENKLDQPMGSLSGGQRQALTLLMGVIDDTKILLMDEPTAALDPRSSEVIIKLAEKINAEKGTTILLVTHSMKDALQYGNRLLMFQSGKLIKDIKEKEKKELSLPMLYDWFG